MSGHWNQEIIEEFRANEGKVGGHFEGAPILLLHSTGAKSGKERINPMMYQAVGDRFAVFASKGGGPKNPDWYHNLIANPTATIEVGTERFPVRARVASGSERASIWETQKERYPTFARYETTAGREIPVVILERIDEGEAEGERLRTG